MPDPSAAERSSPESPIATPPAVPFPARRAMQEAIWSTCIHPAEQEWTTWTDSIALAECAADALLSAGWRVVPLDALDIEDAGAPSVNEEESGK